MKKISIILTVLIFASFGMMAQSPEKFSYQAVVRNASNALVSNAPVGVRVSILQGSATGNAVYVETQTVTTNANGLLTLEIGSGSVQQGTFFDINWANGPYFLKTETDPNGGTNYNVTSTQQLLSVPYALYAKDAGNAFSGDYNDLTNTPTIPTVPTNVSAFTNDAGYITGYTETDPQFNAWDKDYNDLINKPSIPTVPTTVSAFTNDAGYITNTDIPVIPTVPTNVSAFVNDVPYLTSFTEQQVLTISNDTIFLTGCSYVKLPEGFNGDYNSLTNRPELFSGDYNDLTNQPIIPTVPENVSAFTNDVPYITAQDIPEIPTLPTNVSAFENDVPYLTAEQQILSISNDTIFLTGGSFVKLPEGFSGSWNDLTDKPEIPEIPEIPTVPDSVSAFTNDAGYITMAELQELLNDLYGAIDSLNDRIEELEGDTTTTPITPNIQHGQHCPGTPTVTDYDGNIYNTVLVGTQCWMRENLKTTHYANGDPISEGIAYSSEIPYRYTPNGNAVNVTTYGYLYNWPAVMHGDSSCNANPGGIQGVCPAGWHVPSAAEWDQLAIYVNSQSEFLCGGYNNYIAKALASNIGWNHHNVSDNCAVCNDLTQNNATGFSAMPAGERYGSSYYGFGDMAVFSSSTLEDDDEIEIRGFCYDDADLTQWLCDADGNLEEGYSVRCVRGDASTGEQLPKVVTLFVSDISANTASVLGHVINSGSTPVTARGVCYSTSPNPTINDSHTNDGSGSGAFTSNLTGLTNGTLYNLRAYATNSLGTTYGEEISFITYNPNDGQPCTGMPTLTDYDGNVYNTVQIGTQCWMKENLRTTHYANGNECNLYSSSSYDNQSTPWRYAPNNSSSNVATYGYLYNQPAVMHGSTGSNSIPSGVLGICPLGWHVPSLAEFQLLTGYLGTHDIYTCNNYRNNIAKALADVTGWYNDSYDYECSINLNPSQNNASGFSARPAGCRSGDFGSKAFFWTTSTSQDNNYYATSGTYYLGLYYYSTSISTLTSTNGWSNNDAFSVRCVRDESNATAMSPTVTTDSVRIISEVVASFYGTVTSSGDATVTEHGVCWNTTSNPTLENNHQASGGGIGTFSTVVGEFTPGTTYYLRAYAINSAGTGYGNELTFTMPDADAHGQPCIGMPTVTDHEGNIYNTVQIGGQCWMKENMRCTTSPKGTLGQNSDQEYYNDTTSIIPLEKRGLLYNWEGAMDTIVNGIPYTPIYLHSSKGICPEGWHIPSSSEWTTLQNYVQSQSEYLCGGVYNNIAKAMAYPYYWKNYDNNCSVGNSPANNNATGFSAIPAGIYNSTISGSGDYAYFWSSSTYFNSSNYSFYYAPIFELTYADAQAYSSYHLHMGNNRCSVRCLRNIAVTTDEATDVTATSATLNSSVSYLGNITITSRGFEWRRNSDSIYTASTPTSWTTSSTSLTMSCTLYGLDPSISYTYRAFITYGGITYYGNEVTFTTIEAVAPTVTTTDATNVTATSATLNGIISNPDDLTITPKGFELKKVTDSTYTVINISTYSTLSRYIYSLDPNTSFTYRAFITYKGVTIYGNDVTFTTLEAVAPTVTTTDATNVTATTATLHGSTSNPDNVSIYSRGFEWKISANTEYTTANITLVGNMAHYLTDLATNTQYTYRAFVTTSDSTIYGNEISFMTLEIPLEPTVISSPASNIFSTSATLNGSVTNPDNVVITAQGFEWKPSNGSAYTLVSVTGATMSYDLTGLTANTQYVYRTFATTTNGTSYGNEIMFTTPSEATYLFEDFSAITDSASYSITNQLDQYTQISGWTGSWVYPSTGKVKIGKSAEAGFLQTPPIDLSGNNGQFLVTFDAKAWPNDNTSLIVAVDGISYTVEGLSTTSFNTFSVPFSGGTTSTIIKFQGFQNSRSRFFLDNVLISTYEPGIDITPPYVASANPNGSTIVVTFNENLDPASAQTTSNYVLDHNLIVTSATLDNNAVTLVVTPELTESTYTLIVSNVSDIAGNVMLSPDTITFTYGVSAEFQVANIAALRTKWTEPLDFNGVHFGNDVYKLSGHAIVTGINDTYRHQIFIQDASGAIVIDDPNGKVTSALETGDEIANIYGKLNDYYGLLQFAVSEEYNSPALSIYNDITPLTVTVAEMQNVEYMNAHQCELLRMEGVTFNETGSFVNGTKYTLTQNGTSGTGVWIHFFNVAGITGDPIPTTPINLTGVNKPSYGAYYLIPRCDGDISSDMFANSTESDVVVYPSIADDHLNVNLNTDAFQVSNVSIYDQAGELLFTQPVFNNLIDINVHNLPNGSYFLRLSNNHRNVTTTFVK